MEVKGRPAWTLQLPGLWSNSYGAWEWWLLFSQLQVVVMLNKYFSIFQQWIELGVYYFAFNLGGGQISSEYKYIFQLCLERHFPHFFLFLRSANKRTKGKGENEDLEPACPNTLALAQLSWWWKLVWDMAKELKFILSPLIHFLPIAEGKYPSQFASRYSIHKFPWQLWQLQ